VPFFFFFNLVFCLVVCGRSRENVGSPPWMGVFLCFFFCPPPLREVCPENAGGYPCPVRNEYPPSPFFTPFSNFFTDSSLVLFPLMGSVPSSGVYAMFRTPHVSHLSNHNPLPRLFFLVNHLRFFFLGVSFGTQSWGPPFNGASPVPPPGRSPPFFGSYR